MMTAVQHTWYFRLLKSVFAVFVGAFGGSYIFVFLTKLIWRPVWQRFSDMYIDNTRYVFEANVSDISPICIFMALSFMLFVGLPAQAALQKLRVTSYVVNVGLCTIMGALAVWALRTLIPFTSLEALGFGAGLAYCIASITWLIRRPDKDDPKPPRPISPP